MIIIIEVNIEELNKNIMMLSSLINEYEEIKLNLFNQLKDSTLNWRDGNSIEFENEIYLEKQDSELFLETIKTKKELFDLVYNRYQEIAKKIKCNLNNKSTLMSVLDTCYNSATEAINSFNSLDRSLSCPELGDADSQKRVIIEVRSKIGDVKRETINLLDKIDNIEKEINEKTNALEEIKINDFDYYLGE